MRYLKQYLIYHLLFLILLSTVSLKTLSQTPDPGIPGPYAVSKLMYNLGDLAFKPESFPDFVEVAGSVHYPTDLSAAPFPVLIFLHGRHETCYNLADPDFTQLDWPCSGGFVSITSFTGYDYLCENMASHGYIVISISANGINANDNSLSDYGMNARAELLQHHLDIWNDYNTIGGAPFDSLFVGKLDMNNIGTMGHSRGGEGVVMQALLNKSLGSPYGIHAVLSLAPVDFLRSVLTDIPFMNIAPYCDGDVSDLQGVHYYDDARYADTIDEAAKHSVLMMGANHNFYNTVWTPGLYIAGTVDDWDAYHSNTTPYCGSDADDSKRLSYAEQQAAFITYASAFFRTYIGNENQFLPILKVQDIIPPASSTLDSSQVFVSYHPPVSKRLDINKTDDESTELINTLSGVVSTNDLTTFDICADDFSEINCDVSFSPSKEPHSGSGSVLGMAQLALAWNDTTAWYANEIPVTFWEVSKYAYLQFRAAVNFAETDEDAETDFTIQLIDTAGNESTVLVSDYTNVLFYPPGSSYYSLPKVLFNTIKIPVKAFEGVNKRHIQQIRFLFDQADASSIFITDISFTGKFEGTFPDFEFHEDTVIPQGVNATPDVNAFIYPNPTDAIIHIQFDELLDINYIQVFNMFGELCYQSNSQIEREIEIDLSSFNNGVYIIQINTKNITQNYQVIKLE